MKSLENLAKQNFNIPYEVIGTVIATNDPLKRGRIQCKMHGITELAEIQPWIETKGELFGSSKETSGISSSPKIGSRVYISFLYHNPSFPIITGRVRVNEDSSLLHKVENLSNTISGTRSSNLSGNELPPLNSSSIYPENNVIETKSAVIEIDDTDGNHRICIQHKNGSYFEIRPDGTVQVKSKENTYNIIQSNRENYIGGSSNEIVGGGSTITSPMSTFIGDITVTGDIIVGGIVTASDCISDTISGKNHTHNESIGSVTSKPN